MTTETQAALTTREVRDEDWGGIAALINQYETDGVTGEILLARSNRWTEGDPRLQLVTVDGDGKVFGYARSLRRASDAVGRFSTMVYVDKAFAGRGLGLALITQAESHARHHGATFLISFVTETCERGLKFAAQSGYRPSQRLFESKLRLGEFDPTSYLAAKARLEEEGYRFTTLAKEGVTDSNCRRLYKLDSVIDIDTPGYENWGERSYEQYLKDEHESHGFTPAGVFIAERGGEWVAMTAVRPSPIAGQFHIDYTGVLRNHRGKGLAHVLKALAILYALDEGGQVMQTNNDDRNVAMLKINQEMGFVPQPGFHVMRKELNNE
jgi:GNAT superfamily N-acetyltransferase